MEKGEGSIWHLVLLIPGLLPACWSEGEMSSLLSLDGWNISVVTSEGLTSNTIM